MIIFQERRLYQKTLSIKIFSMEGGIYVKINEVRSKYVQGKYAFLEVYEILRI